MGLFWGQRCPKVHSQYKDIHKLLMFLVQNVMHPLGSSWCHAQQDVTVAPEHQPEGHGFLLWSPMRTCKVVPRSKERRALLVGAHGWCVILAPRRAHSSVISRAYVGPAQYLLPNALVRAGAWGQVGEQSTKGPHLPLPRYNWLGI